jgi:alpha,alpha-trehalose phosphorylase
VHVEAGNPVRVGLGHQGPRLTGAPTTSDIEGTRRSDGTVITASIPTISMTPEPEVLTGP